MSSDFLPANYVVPDKTNGYMRFLPGNNKVRILAKPILGYQWWVDKEGKDRVKGQKPQEGDKPVRVKMDSNGTVQHADTLQHFWAMPVWNYEVEQIQIMQITQKGIQKALTALIKNSKWGDPTEYDIVITKTGEGLDTEYNVTPEPKEPVAQEIGVAFSMTDIHLEALFEGGDPFNYQPQQKVDDKDLPF